MSMELASAVATRLCTTYQSLDEGESSRHEAVFPILTATDDISFLRAVRALWSQRRALWVVVLVASVSKAASAANALPVSSTA